MVQPLLESEIPGLEPCATGKVRDMYDLGNTMLIVASDRISAFDVVMPNGIPDKGRVLTQLSRHWFRTLRTLVPTHYVSCDIDFIADQIVERGGELDAAARANLTGRSMIGIKAEAFPIEC